MSLRRSTFLLLLAAFCLPAPAADKPSGLTMVVMDPLAAPLAARTGATIYAYGGPEAGRSAVMTDLAAQGLTGGGEGIDTTFRPDVEVADGETINGDGWQLEVIHTPGHAAEGIVLYNRKEKLLISSDTLWKNDMAVMTLLIIREF